MSLIEEVREQLRQRGDGTPADPDSERESSRTYSEPPREPSRTLPERNSEPPRTVSNQNGEQTEGGISGGDEGSDPPDRQSDGH